jgi:hypothetical protein
LKDQRERELSEGGTSSTQGEGYIVPGFNIAERVSDLTNSVRYIKGELIIPLSPLAPCGREIERGD